MLRLALSVQNAANLLCSLSALIGSGRSLLMRSFWCLILLIGSCVFAFSQAAPSDPSSTSALGTAQVTQDPAQPQNQMPPDGKAPAPTPTANRSDSNASQAAPAQSSEPRYLRTGTDIRAALDTPLSSKTSKVGDRFTATIEAPVKDSSGNVVIPIGSKLNGQISEPVNAKLEGAIKDMGHIDLRFTDIQLPDGTDVPISAALISVHNNHADSSKMSTTRQNHPGTSAIGANTGGVTALGRPIKGVAVGNLAGGGYVLATTSKQVGLPAESVLRLRTDRNTTLP